MRKSSSRTSPWLTLAASLLLIAVCLLSAAERMRLPLPFGLSCKLPTPEACIADIKSQTVAGIDADMVARAKHAAIIVPGDADIQALVGVLLANDPERGAEAEAFLRNSARLGWREPAGQLFSYQSALAAGDIDRAMLHLDALLRLDPEYSRNQALLDSISSNPDLVAGFGKRLAAQPGYLRRILVSLRTAPEEGWDQRIAMLDAAREAGLDLDDATLNSSVWPIFRRDPRKALDLWRSLEGDGAWAVGAAAWDPDADKWPLQGAPSPFVWHAVDNARTPLTRAVKDGSNWLVLAEDHTSTAQELAGVALPLEPGTYQLSWAATSTSTRLYPTINCARGGASIDDLEMVDTGRWNAYLTVGDDCAMPVLSISKGSGKVSEGTGIGHMTVGGAAILD